MDTSDGLLPREKMLRSGIASLSDVELLALFFTYRHAGKRCYDVGKRDVAALWGRCMVCCRRTLRSFRSVNGIGLAKFAQFERHC
nr:DNA repair protein RadC [Salmonella sp. NCTC 7297]